MIFYCQGTAPSKWIRDEDYYRMDGSTGAEKRRKFTCDFNDVKNERSLPLLPLSMFYYKMFKLKKKRDTQV